MSGHAGAALRAALASTDQAVLFRLLTEASRDILSIHGAADGHPLFLSPACEAITGHAPDALLRRDLYPFIHPDDVDAVQAVMQAMRTATSPCRPISFRFRHRDGDWRWMELMAAPVRDETGVVTHIIASTRESTERRQLLDRVRRSEGRLRGALESLRDGVVLLEREPGVTDASALRVMDLNSRAAAMLEIVREDLLDHPVREAPPRPGLTRLLAACDAALASGASHIETLQTAAEASARGWIRHEVTHEGPLLVAVLRDVSHDWQVATRLERKAQILEHVQHAVMATDADGLITYWNAAATRLFGWTREELLGKPLWHRYPAERHDEIRRWIERLAAGDEFVGEFEDIRRDGSTVWIHASVRRLETGQGEFLGIVGMSRDITAERAEEVQRAARAQAARQAEELARLQRLAGGIAHDFNNLLTGVLGHASLLALDLPADSALQERIARIRDGCDRAARLTTQLLAFAGRSRLTLADGDLDRLLRNVVRELEAPDVRLEAREGSFVLACDGAALSEALRLVLRYALERRAPGGRVEITLSSQRERPRVREHHRGGAPREAERYLVVRIAYRPGAPVPDDPDTLLEPFVATQQPGLELGLPAALGAIRAHGGAMTIDRREPADVVISVILPAPAGGSVVVPAAWRGSGHALVVDDEPEVLDVTARLLERLGLTVRCAAGLRDAELLLAADTVPVDIALIDLTMPEADGVETLAQLRRHQPGLRAVLMSGYSEVEVEAKVATCGAQAFLHKPFHRDELVAVLRRVLEA